MPTTSRTLLIGLAARFAAAGVDAPRLTAELMLAKSLACSRLELLTDQKRILSRPEIQEAERLTDRRLAGEPVAYILGVKEFFGRDFQVGPGVLIPRPETELLVDLVCRWTGTSDRFHFVDLGTGSGVLLATIAAERPASGGIGTDLSGDALLLAQKNCRALGVIARTLVLRTDLGRGLGEGKFDIVVSNPPYLSDEDMCQLNPEVSGFEPVEALYGGPAGTEVCRRVVEEAEKLLRPGGLLLMEIGAEQGPATLEFMGSRWNRWKAVTMNKDLSQKDRVLSAVRCGQSDTCG